MNFTDFKEKYQKTPVEEYPNNASHQPLVSVCVQTYQHANYIRECLDGILMQKTDFPFEILLGEDSSTDGTREICIEYAEKYPDKIRLFLHHRENNININGNPTGRFNLLYNLFNARGEYVALCEGDDYWIDSWKLQKQVDFLENNEEYTIHCTNAKISKNDKFTTKAMEDKTFIALDIFKQNFTYTGTLCFHKDSITIPNFIYNSPAADWLLILYALKHNKGYFSKDISAVYRIHSQGIWSQVESNDREMIKRRFENLVGNIYTYKQIFKDEELPIEVRNYAPQKMESYSYQAKRMMLIHPFLKVSREDFDIKRSGNRIKLLLVRLKLLS